MTSVQNHLQLLNGSENKFEQFEIWDLKSLVFSVRLESFILMIKANISILTFSFYLFPYFAFAFAYKKNDRYPFTYLFRRV